MPRVLIPLVLLLPAVVGCGSKPTTPATTLPTVPAVPPITITMPKPVDPTKPADPPKPATPDPKETAKKNLRQIGLALHNFDSAHGHFPAGVYAKGAVGLSWRVQILPYIEQDNLYRQFKLDEPWDSETNKKLIERMPGVFASPGKPAEKGQTYLRAFAGPAAYIQTPAPAGQPGQFVRGRTIVGISDGTSNTLLVAEAAEPVVWTKPDELTYDGTATAQPKPLPKLGGAFADGFHGLTGDAQVKWLRDTLPEDTLRALITATGGEVFSLPADEPAGGKPPPKPAPAVVPDSLPDAAARNAAVDHLRRVHAALGIYADANGHLPAGVVASKDAVGLSWRVQILPYLQQENLYRQFKLTEPWDSEHNKKLLDQMPDVFASAGKKAEKGHTYLRTTRGPQGVVFAPVLQPGQKPPPFAQAVGQPVSGRRFTDLADGLTITITVAEAETAVPWTKPDELDLLPAPPAEQKTPGIVRMTPPKLGGVFDGGFHALLADGTVVFYKASLPGQDLGALLTVAGGEPVDARPAAHVLYAVPPKK